MDSPVLTFERFRLGKNTACMCRVLQSAWMATSFGVICLSVSSKTFLETAISEPATFTSTTDLHERSQRKKQVCNKILLFYLLI